MEHPIRAGVLGLALLLVAVGQVFGETPIHRPNAGVEESGLRSQRTTTPATLPEILPDRVASVLGVPVPYPTIQSAITALLPVIPSM